MSLDKWDIKDNWDFGSFTSLLEFAEYCYMINCFLVNSPTRPVRPIFIEDRQWSDWSRHWFPESVIQNSNSGWEAVPLSITTANWRSRFSKKSTLYKNCNWITVWREKNQQDATIRCLLLTYVSTCFGHHYAHLQENKEPVTVFGVLFWFCWMWLVAVVWRCVVGCEHCSHPTTQLPTTATNHIQQNQNNTPNAVTGPLFSWRWA